MNYTYVVKTKQQKVTGRKEVMMRGGEEEKTYGF